MSHQQLRSYEDTAYSLIRQTGGARDTHMSHDMRSPSMWNVQPAKAQTSLRIRAV